jgi:hypothetical protein
VTVQVIGVPELPRLRVLGETLIDTSNPKASDAKSIAQAHNTIVRGKLFFVVIISASKLYSDNG